MKSALVTICVLLIMTAALAEAFQADGIIEPHRVVNLGSPQRGVIAAVEVERGDTVKKGQILARLQSEVEEALMEMKKANMEFTGRKTERMEPLFKKELLAKADMDEAETGKAVARAEYKYATETVNRLRITSPINGVIVQRFLSPGEYVENQPIMKVAEIDPLNVEVILPLSKYKLVNIGMKARVQPESPIGGQYSASVIIKDKVIDAASGTFGVRLILSNPGFRIPAGIKCKVIFP